MNKELVINVSPGEITIALVEDKQLVELNTEKGKTGFAVGDIYLGKVKKIMPGLNAAFVNVGHEKDAFVHYLDLGPQFTTVQKLTNGLISKRKGLKFETMKMDPPLGKSGKIASHIASGQPILVQIAKEAISTKGPRLTSDISLAGRHVVLMPFTNKVSVSQKIRSNEERKRLKRIADANLPNNYGVIIRTAAQGKGDDDIAQDITSLIQRWESAMTRLHSGEAATPPQLLLGEMNRATAIIRDLLNGSFSAIVTNDAATYEEIREYIKTIAPEKEKIVKLYKGKEPLFDHYDISKQIKSLFAKYVSLKKGAYLIVEHTEALHVIDVNSGARNKTSDDQEVNAMDVNLQAAVEIARQLRLRDMGGIIVIDFIDLHKGDNRNQLFEKMTEAMSTDRARHTILPVSKFGLMQITRQRVRPETAPEVQETCPTCGGTGTIVPSILLEKQIENQIAYFTSDRKVKYIKLKVSPYVESYLRRGLPSIRRKWAWKYGATIKIASDQSTGFVETKFLDENDKELI
ncbi:MAG: Rne/Rng family ribonuclease [Rikenellaceae bacterium]|jgi:ribonuclease G|nr:Rne/Rng family ribonuclease [Rikenellaceae bacterium]